MISVPSPQQTTFTSAGKHNKPRERGRLPAHDRVPGEGELLGDAMAHQARTDDRNPPEVVSRHGSLPRRPQPLARKNASLSSGRPGAAGPRSCP
jgi:hypothetical protein